jgi:hypothetical protein
VLVCIASGGDANPGGLTRGERVRQASPSTTRVEMQLAGLPTEAVDRIYRALYVHTVSFQRVMAGEVNRMLGDGGSQTGAEAASPRETGGVKVKVSSSRALPPPHAARDWARPPRRRSKNQSCFQPWVCCGVKLIRRTQGCTTPYQLTVAISHLGCRVSVTGGGAEPDLVALARTLQAARDLPSAEAAAVAAAGAEDGTAQGYFYEDMRVLLETKVGV